MKSNIRQVIGGRGFFLKRAFNDRGYVALFIASYRGHANIVSKLMALGINACRKMPSGRSAIQVAIFNKRINCVNALVGKSRGISDDENGENCVRRSTIFNISQQLGRKDGWRMLVTQLQERLGRRDCDDPMKGLVPLREFQKFDSAFPAYLKGRRNKRLLCVCSSFIFTFQMKLHVIINTDIITV